MVATLKCTKEQRLGTAKHFQPIGPYFGLGKKSLGLVFICPLWTWQQWVLTKCLALMMSFNICCTYHTKFEVLIVSVHTPGLKFKYFLEFYIYCACIYIFNPLLLLQRTADHWCLFHSSVFQVFSFCFEF